MVVERDNGHATICKHERQHIDARADIEQPPTPRILGQLGDDPWIFQCTWIVCREKPEDVATRRDDVSQQLRVRRERVHRFEIGRAYVVRVIRSCFSIHDCKGALKFLQEHAYWPLAIITPAARQIQRNRRCSASAISRASEATSVEAENPSRARALAASPTSVAASSGRKNSSLTATSVLPVRRSTACSFKPSPCQSSAMSAAANARPVNSRIDVATPVAST